MPFDFDLFTSRMPVFTGEDLAQELTAQGDQRVGRKLLDSWTKQGRLISLARGIYAIPSPPKDGNRGAWPDPFLAVAKAAPGGVIVGYGAMALHTGTPPRIEIEVRSATGRTHGMDFKIPLKLVYVTRHISGFSEEKKAFQGGTITVCAPEATLIDCVNEIRSIADCEVCRSAINHPNWFDFGKVIQILQQSSTPKVTLARFGAFMTLIQGPMAEWDYLFHAISRSERLPSEAVRWQEDKPGIQLPEWRIVVPHDFLQWASNLHGTAFPTPPNGNPPGFAVDPEELRPLDIAETMEPAWLMPGHPHLVDGFEPGSVLQDVLQTFPALSNGAPSFTLRPGQAEIIEAVRGGHDTLGILPTGSGKSLIYQYLSKKVAGTALIISPLRSLMEDQIIQARDLGLKAEQLHSGTTRKERIQTTDLFRNGILNLLFITPEGLKSFVWSYRQDLSKIKLLVIDEAHCISGWGLGFRKAYLDIGAYRYLFPEVPILALTATASPSVQRDIAHYLDMRRPFRFVGSVVRKNLRLSVTTIERSLPARIGCAKKLVRHDSDRQSGIIYCGTTKWCDKVAHHFNDEHIRTAVYHAKLPIQLRNQSQTAFMSDDVQFVAATVAFGMGLNKPNVRRVIHMELPSSLENYVQEIGRAGRDGNQSDCNLFLGLGDLLREYYRKSSGDPKMDSIRIANVKKIWKYAKTKSCRWQFIAEHFEGLNSGIKHEPCGVCDNCLSQLISVPHGFNKK